jgi:hypothetical protein
MECHQQISNSLGRDFVAFMALDASEPSQQTIAAAVSRRSSVLMMNKNASSLESVRNPVRSALDDDPAVKALAGVLQGQ